MPRTIPSHNGRRQFQDEVIDLDQDMTGGDIVETLEQMKFCNADHFRMVKMDQPIRDFIVTALRRKA